MKGDNMEESKANDSSELKKTHFGKDNFRMFYALGPEVEQVNSDELDNDERTKKFDDFTTDFDKDDLQCKHERIDDELSDDSGTVEDKEWKGCSIPPDIVLSASNLKVVKVEPKRSGTWKSQGKVDQDITDFRRHQVEAYTNLEDLLDEPWEESDFATPTDNELSTNSSSDAKDMIRMKVMKQIGLGQAQCGPMCNNCAIM